MLKPNVLLLKLEESLSNNKFDYKTYIDELGQVEACKKRLNGFVFSFEEHLRGLIYSLLSNQRPWKKIAENAKSIDKIFFNFDPKKIKETNPDHFIEKIKIIGCGNRAIKKQMESLCYNIDIFLKIEAENDSLDKFVTSATPKEIAIKLGGKGEYKLKQIGIPLASEYLKNVGIEAIKPDLQIMRILSKKRLGYLPGNSETQADKMEAVNKLEEIAKEIGCGATYLDNILWLFCADGYGEICTSNPKCDVCKLSDNCNMM